MYDHKFHPILVLTAEEVSKRALSAVRSRLLAEADQPWRHLRSLVPGERRRTHSPWRDDPPSPHADDERAAA
jgi:hypothetical protein